MAAADLLPPPVSDVDVPAPDFVVPSGFEAVDGRLVEKPLSRKSSWVGGELFFLLRSFCQAHPVGRVYPQDTAFRCFPGRPRHVRKPDVAFIRTERDTPELSDSDVSPAPDLVVEVISPNETVVELDERIADYRSVGVPLIWVVNPTARAVRVLRADGTGNDLTETDTLDGEAVLPGFACRVADFLPPAPASAATV